MVALDENRRLDDTNFSFSVTMIWEAVLDEQGMQGTGRLRETGMLQGDLEVSGLRTQMFQSRPRGLHDIRFISFSRRSN